MNTISVKKHEDYGEGVYGDVLSHSIRPERRESRYTNVHETSHYISSELRQRHNPGYNCFYILRSQAVVIKEPPTTINQIAPLVPPNLRGSRYKTYLIDQRRYWDESPLYILDEWNAYCLGGMCAIDDYQNKRKLEKTDALAGMFEFMIYSTALAMCVKERCPEYWKINTQFKDFVGYRIDTVSRIFFINREIPQFKSISSDKLYQTWHNSDEGKSFQSFINDEFVSKKILWSLDKVF
jgi:hypothetical protein